MYGTNYIALTSIFQFQVDRRMDSRTGQDYNVTCVAPTDGQLRLGLVELFSWDQMWQKVLGAVLFVIVKHNYEYFWYALNCIYDPHTHSSTFLIFFISWWNNSHLKVQIYQMIPNPFPFPLKIKFKSHFPTQNKETIPFLSLSHLILTSIQMAANLFHFPTVVIIRLITMIDRNLLLHFPFQSQSQFLFLK